MPRLVKITDLLSDEARHIMISGLKQGSTAEAISEQVQKATGEEVASRTVGRFGTDWRAKIKQRREAREFVHSLMEEGISQGEDVSGMLVAWVLEYFERHPDALKSLDAMAAQRIGLQAESLQLKHRQVDVQEQRLELEQRKAELVEERERAAIAALKDKQKGEELSPEERITRVREIYGLTDGTAE